MRKITEELMRFLNSLHGAEDPPKNEKEDEDEEEEENEEENEEDEEDEKSSSDKTSTPEDNEALLKALRKERADRKKFAKEARGLKKFKDEIESKDQTDSQKAQREAEKSKQVGAKLAAKLKQQAVDMAITQAAASLNFVDVGDVLSLLPRSDDWVEQDEDDPSEIEIDTEAIQAAVKKLSEDKKHLLKLENEEEGDPSGSKFGGKKRDKTKMSEDALKEKYSALGSPST